MKKLFFAILVCVCNVVFAQNVNPFNSAFRTFDTNGPMGECLFDTIDNGEIIYRDVVHVEHTKIELKEIAIRFFELLDKESIYDVRVVQNEKESSLEYDVNVASGRQMVDAGFGSWERDRSTVRCHVRIELKDGRYRYTVNPYETNRQTIRGEAKSDGRPNEIHWQRVNSLMKERPREGWSRRYVEYDEMIKEEKSTYKAEYDAIQKLVGQIASFCKYVEDIDGNADF